ncbi:MAG: acyl-CoA carboxylase subunit beta [Frankiaceae bacterium]|jgi:acetyl-CoA carboxylase carboxyl transferase subunit beta|nr:acyl-CoA carboxylase subunit beta [Frankiaceae bacterium]
MLPSVSDWRAALLKRFSFPAYERLGRNPTGWPGYEPAEVVRYAIGAFGGVNVVAVVWDFGAFGGSFGELDAAAFAEAADRAARYGEPLVSFVRSGGVRLQEGMAALVGMPRAQLALRRLAAAGVPHVAVADDPTTGGVYVSVVTRADVRAAVRGATVGFAGPRVAEAVLGAPLPAGSHTAESAYDAGLVDALLAPEEVGGWLARTLTALTVTASPSAGPAGRLPDAEDASGEAQVARARRSDRPSGGALLDLLVPNGVDLRGADETVRAVAGDLGGTPAVAVAVAADRRVRPTPAGYRLVQRAAALAGRLDRVLVTLVDTPGAEPGPDAERDGVASAIADTMDAVLACPAPTLAVVTGEGGSGGALAAGVADRVLVTPGGYFAALGPEAAAAALRSTAGATAKRLRLRPVDLLALGFADAAAPEPDDASFATYVAAQAAHLAGLDPAERRAARERRWSSPLPGTLT